MTRPPLRRGPSDARSIAEAAFKKATTPQPPSPPPPARPVVPGAKEQVTLRIDQEVLEFFRAGGPGWQDRINEVLRKAAGK